MIKSNAVRESLKAPKEAARAFPVPAGMIPRLTRLITEAASWNIVSNNNKQWMRTQEEIDNYLSIYLLPLFPLIHSVPPRVIHLRSPNKGNRTEEN